MLMVVAQWVGIFLSLLCTVSSSLEGIYNGLTVEEKKGVIIWLHDWMYPKPWYQKLLEQMITAANLIGFLRLVGEIVKEPLKEVILNSVKRERFANQVAEPAHIHPQHHVIPKHRKGNLRPGQERSRSKRRK